MADLQEVFEQIQQVLEKHEPGMERRDEYIGSQAKVKKPAFHLYGKDPVSVFDRKPEQIYLAGTILQKNFVSLYFMPMYAHPNEFQDIDPRLKKLVKGKACFNIKALDSELIERIDETLSKGKQLFQQNGWI